MSKAMRGQDAVLSALGPKPGEMLTALTKRNWTMEQFAANTLMAMKKAKVKKLVLSPLRFVPGPESFRPVLGRFGPQPHEGLERHGKSCDRKFLELDHCPSKLAGPGQDEQYRAQVGALPAKALKTSFRALAKFMLDTVEGRQYQRQISG